MTDSTTIARDMRQEAQRLRALAEQLDHVAELCDNGAAPEPAPSKPKATKPRRKGRGRPRGTGKTQDRINAALQQHGPLTINEIAGAIGIRPNYLYRAMPAGMAEGRYARDGNRWKLTEAPSETKDDPTE